MVEPVLEVLAVARGGWFIDSTVGLAGHSEAILEASDDTRVIGIDQDGEAIDRAVKRLARFGERFRAVHGSFADLATIAADQVSGPVNGILADLGVSSLQLDSETRGFSFRFDAPLDMRMDPDSRSMTAADLLAEATEGEIADILYEYGEERASRRIARRIVERRAAGRPVQTTTDLARLIEQVLPRGPKQKIHPATRAFQALRIAVNRELEILEQFVRDSVETLAADGRVAIITFHSLEDRIVKRTLQNLAGKCSCPPRMPICQCRAVRKIEILTKRPIVPDEPETAANPRSRSAKLRGARKI